MPTKRDLLHLLTRDELIAIADAFEVPVEDRRSKDKLVDALAGSKKATLASFLPDLSRDRLKELCRAHDLDDSGREKIALVERLSGIAGSTPAESIQTNGSPKSTPPPSKKPVNKNGAAPKRTGGDLGFEATLWQAADKLRNNMDAAEYKHVVLGLIFLKYISDAFQERYRELEGEVGDGADPEDPDEYRAKNIFWVPQDARWEKIQANAKKPSNGQAIDDAMTSIERENTSLKGVLPKNYGSPSMLVDARRDDRSAGTS